jgi:hypothetical protein
MSAPAGKLPLVERSSDWLNPILIKETRQALKSRQFVGTFLLMLVAAWLISVFGIVISGVGVEYRSAGGGFFYAYYVVLAVAIFIVVPFGAFRSLLGERDLHTWEVLSISTLKPRQIVWGKLASSVVQLFIYYSAITPFIAFANLLKGIDVPTIAFVLIASMLWSVTLSMVALTISTFSSQRHWQVFLTLGVLGGLVSGFVTALSIVGSSMQFGMPFDEPGFWWVVGAMVTYLIAYGALFLQIAIAQLTFDADNRSSGIRLAAAALFWIALAWISVLVFLGGSIGLPAWPAGAMDELLFAFGVVAGIHWSVTGLFAATEPDVLSRRVRRDLMRFGSWRVVTTPFVPGGGRGMVYLIGHLGALFAFAMLMAYAHPSLNQNAVLFTLAICFYIVIYVGFGAALGRAARSVSGDFRPAHARVLTVLMLALAAVLPQTLYFIDTIRQSPHDHPGYFITDPFSTLYRIADGTEQSTFLLFLLGGGALLSLMLNLRAMLGGVMDVARPYVPPAPSIPREVSTATG